MLALSTDKLCAPINLYGTIKLALDKLFIAANNICRWNPIKFSIVRYGSVIYSLIRIREDVVSTNKLLQFTMQRNSHGSKKV